MLLKERFINRLDSDKADVTTTSILLWITFTVVLFTVVSGYLFWIISQRSYQVNNCVSWTEDYLQDPDGAHCADWVE